MKKWIEVSQRFPAVPLTSTRMRYLEKIAHGTDPQRYLAFALVLATVSGLLMGIAYGNAGMGIGTWTGMFALLLYLPELEFRRYVDEIERELPFALRDWGTLVALRVPFTQALGNVAKGEGALARELAHLHQEMQQGIDFTKAIGERARFLESDTVTRAFAQLVSVYEEGGGGKELKRLGDELLLARAHRLQEYAGKSALIGLLFIAVAAMAPTFFLVVSGLGNVLGNAPWPAASVPLVLLVVFPLAMVLVALLGKALAPDPLFAERKARSYAPLAVLIPLALVALVLEGWLLIIAVAAVGMGTAAYLYPRYQKERRWEQVEAQLPERLLLAAGLPRGAGMERVLQVLANGRDALAEEGRIALRQWQSGIRSESVIADFIQRNPSEGIQRAMRLVQQTLETNRLERLHEIAEDLLRMREIRRQRTALLAVQRYTLLAGAVLVPLILGNALALLERMARLTGTVVAPITQWLPVYVLAYALVSGYYLADLEARPSQALLYFAGMAIAGITTLYFL